MLNIGSGRIIIIILWCYVAIYGWAILGMSSPEYIELIVNISILQTNTKQSTYQIIKTMQRKFPSVS